MQFTKAHGCGNDFIILDRAEAQSGALSERSSLTEWAGRLCDRHTGIGADGLLVISPTASDRGPSYEMTVINADGSLAEMCGNGLRCVADYLRREGRLRSGEQLKTGAGDIEVYFSHPPALLPSRERTSLIDRGSWVGARLASPQVVRAEHVLSEEGEGWDLTYVSLGNPHAVTFDEVAFARREELTPALSAHFTTGVNLSFAQLVEAGHIRLHVHERGCGWTQACGTGACATAVAAVRSGLAPSGEPLMVSLPGGQLIIEHTSGGPIMMWGPALEVFRGQLSL